MCSRRIFEVGPFNTMRRSFFVFCSTVKNALGYDDSLDVFGIHCIGGILGALALGLSLLIYLATRSG